MGDPEPLRKCQLELNAHIMTTVLTLAVALCWGEEVDTSGADEVLSGASAGPSNWGSLLD